MARCQQWCEGAKDQQNGRSEFEKLPSTGCGVEVQRTKSQEAQRTEELCPERELNWAAEHAESVTSLVPRRFKSRSSNPVKTPGPQSEPKSHRGCRAKTNRPRMHRARRKRPWDSGTTFGQLSFRTAVGRGALRLPLAGAGESDATAEQGPGLQCLKQSSKHALR